MTVNITNLFIDKLRGVFTIETTDTQLAGSAPVQIRFRDFESWLADRGDLKVNFLFSTIDLTLSEWMNDQGLEATKLALQDYFFNIKNKTA